MREESQTQIDTTDLECAAYLIARGAVLAGIDTAALAGRPVFQLRGERVDEDVDNYVLGRATVRLNAFRDARKSLLALTDTS